MLEVVISGIAGLMGDFIPKWRKHYAFIATFALFIGACELAGGIGLLIPRLASLAAYGLIIIMCGAVYSHLTHDPPQEAIGALVMGLMCGFVAWRRGVPFRGA